MNAHFLRFNLFVCISFLYTQVLHSGSKHGFWGQEDLCSNAIPPPFSYETLGELLCIPKHSSCTYMMGERVLNVGSNSVLGKTPCYSKSSINVSYNHYTHTHTHTHTHTPKRKLFLKTVFKFILCYQNIIFEILICQHIKNVCSKIHFHNNYSITLVEIIDVVFQAGELGKV